MDKPIAHDCIHESFVQQRHLYNLRSILVKNIRPKYIIDNVTDLCRHSFYFTLHENCRSPAYYKSTKVAGTLNPVWEKVNFRKDGFSNFPDLKKEFVCIRVWMKIDNDNLLEDVKEVVVRWDVDFSALIPVEKEHLIFGHNVILFEFDKGLFTAPFKDKVVSPSRNSIDEINLLNLRTSYRLNSLKRLQLTLRAINEVNKKSEEVKSIISAILNRREKFEGQKEEVERMRCRIDTMKTEFTTICLNLKNTERLCDSQHTLNEIDVIALKENYNSLSSSWQSLHESKKNYFDVRDQLIQTGAHLVRRRKQLLTDMASIYPITKDPVKGRYYIAGVHLPNSEELSGQDEIMLGVAFGFTCHLVKLIGLFLDVPLRYPITHRGSRSTIRDDIIDVLSDKERDFPLFAKGKERYQFEYAVYILNKNIVQLRHYCGMTTSSLGSTLLNLYTLLNDKLGVVKSTRGNAFASQHVLIPPSFGGPLPDVAGRNHPFQPIPAETPISAASMLASPIVSVDSTTSILHAYGPKIISNNQNSFGSIVDIFQEASSSPTTNQVTNTGDSSSLNVINYASKLTSTRSLSPSIESLTSSHEGSGFLSRKLRALEIFRTSPASVSSSPALSNSKFHLLKTSESEMWQEVLNSCEDRSGFVIVNRGSALADDNTHEESSCVMQSDISLRSTVDVGCTDATLNEVLTRLDDMIKVSENQVSKNQDNNLCSSPDVVKSKCSINIQSLQDTSTASYNGASVKDGMSGNFLQESPNRNLAASSTLMKSNPLLFKTLMTNVIETPDNCLSSEDEVPLDI